MIKIFTTSFFSLLAIVVNAQNATLEDHKTIGMKEDKITQLIFPSPIKSFKGGFLPSDFAITAEENVLYIQPVGSFDESNMNILTSDGCYYTFTVKYDREATVFNFVFTADDAIYKESRNPDENMTHIKSSFRPEQKNDRFDGACKKILSRSGYLVSGNIVKVRNVAMLIKGVYTDKDNIFLRLEIINESNIKYEIDFIYFSIQAKKTKKKTAQATQQITPTYIYNLPEFINSKTNLELVACFDKFTIGSEKFLQIFCLENNGERNLKLDISNTIILDAQRYE